MKTIYHILIIFIIITSFFILKDDIVSVLGGISSYVNKNDESQIVKLINEKEIKLAESIDTPGALRVASNLLDIDKDIQLSKENIILLTNKHRKDNGNLKALKENQKLNLSAEKKVKDMFTNQYFEHISPSGVGVANLGQEVGYLYILIGENLALGNFKDDASLVDAWMASEGHRENILNGHYTEIGVAVGRGKFEGRDVWLAVQHFGTPRSICPSVDEVLLGYIDINQNKLKEMEDDLILRREMIDKKVLYEGRSYSEQIDIFNELVKKYNELINDTKEKINNYNNQVSTFNFCLSSNK